MNEKDEEINQQLDDIKHILKKQNSILFSIGLMVIGIGTGTGTGGMALLYVITKVL